MSTVIGLGDLAEDEIISAPMPVTVDAFKVFFLFLYLFTDLFRV